MLKKIGLALLGLAAVIGLAINSLPAHFAIARTTTIHAPADVVYGYVSDLHNFQKWSPWAKADPAMTTSYAGPATGVGASYSWKGNKQVGEGSMTVKELKPPEYAAIDLDFVAPMTAKNLTEFKLKPGTDGVDLTWTMSGNNGFMGKAFGLVMDMDKVVGGQFEAGLTTLKGLAEADGKQRLDAMKAQAAMPAPAAKATP